MMAPLRFALPLLLVGCAFAGLDASDIDSGMFDTDTPVDTSDTGEPVSLEGDWMAVSGVIDLADGQVVGTPALQLEVLASDAEGVLEPVACDATLASPEPVEQAPDDVTLYGNWRFTVEPGTCSGLPTTLELGIGPLLPTLWPSADAMGASLKHTRGLYAAKADRSGLWVFGLAGTTAQIAGEGAPTSLDPLPDGRYHLRSAYLLAL